MHSPQNALPMPNKLVPEAVNRKVKSAGSRQWLSAIETAKQFINVGITAKPATAITTAEGSALNNDTNDIHCH